MASFDYDVVIIGSVRRKRRRAPCRGEGVPGRCHGAAQAVEGRDLPKSQ
jgi:hypothetical protein